MLPEPAPGLVIRYAYLWFDEHTSGQEEGAKERPCAIIAAIRKGTDGRTRVMVVPITHSPPADDSAAIEIPARVKARLGLDEHRSWIIASEWNAFVWPGPDLRRVPGTDDASIAYGFLPSGLFEQLRQMLLTLAQAGRSRPVPRTE